MIHSLQASQSLLAAAAATALLLQLVQLVQLLLQGRALLCGVSAVLWLLRCERG